MNKIIIAIITLFSITILYSQNINTIDNSANVLQNINPQQQFSNVILENNLIQTSNNNFDYNQTAQVLKNPDNKVNQKFNTSNSNTIVRSENLNQIKSNSGTSGGSKMKSKSGFKKWIYQIKKSFQKHKLKKRPRKTYTSKCGSWKGKV